MITSNDILTHQKGLNLFALKLTKGNAAEAEDLLHSTIVRALEKQHLFDTGSNFFGWASKIMFNMFVTKHNKNVRYDTQFDPEPYINAQSTQATQEISTDWHKVEERMMELPANHREIITMICVNGLSYQEVADELGIQLGTVRSRLSRARENIVNLMGPNAGIVESYATAA